MSLFLEKACDSLGTLFSSLETSLGLKAMLEKCKGARSKKEEESLVQECLQMIKLKLSEQYSNTSVITCSLTFVVFAEMLGYKADFAYIHAVNLAQSESLVPKKMGYLACVFFIQESHPLCVLVVNTILRDLGSKNILVIAMAVSASCYLVPSQEVSTILPLLVEKLSHPSEFIRCKVVIALHHFLRKYPEHSYQYIGCVCSLLSDKDPAVVRFVLQFLQEALKVNPGLVLKYIPLLIPIQNQILNGNLPKEYSYYGLPEPWMQISLLRLFQQSSELKLDITSTVQKTMKTVKDVSNGNNIYVKEAVYMECISTLVHCIGDESSIEMAKEYATVLLSSTNNNLRFMGLEVLDNLIQCHQLTLSSQQQRLIAACLEHSDSTLKRKALHVLSVAANKQTADVICSQMADYALCYEGSVHVKSEIVKDAVILTDKFPNAVNYWHVAMLIRLLPAADRIQTKLIQKRIKRSLLTEHGQEVVEVRQKVLRILKKRSLSKTALLSILELFVWTSSHFGSDCDSIPSNIKSITEEIVHLGQNVLNRQLRGKNISPEIVELLISIVDAFVYITQEHGVCPGIVEFVEEIQSIADGNPSLKESCTELLHMLSHGQEVSSLWKTVEGKKQFKKDGTVEESSVSDIIWSEENYKKLDFTLSFLDKYVSESLKKGRVPYRPRFLTVTGFEGVSNFNYECLSLTKSQFVGSPLVCTSPASSEMESLSSFNSEDMKICPIKRLEKEFIDQKPVWTKCGRLPEETDVHKDTYEPLNSSLVDSSEITLRGNNSTEPSSIEENNKSESTKELGHPFDMLLDTIDLLSE